MIFVAVLAASGCQGNVGLIFTKGDLKEVSEEVAKYKVKLLDPLLHNQCSMVFLIHDCRATHACLTEVVT